MSALDLFRRRCGKCSHVFHVREEPGYKQHKIYGLLCAKCVKEREAAAAAKGV